MLQWCQIPSLKTVYILPKIYIYKAIHHLSINFVNIISRVFNKVIILHYKLQPGNMPKMRAMRHLVRGSTTVKSEQPTSS